MQTRHAEEEASHITAIYILGKQTLPMALQRAVLRPRHTYTQIIYTNLTIYFTRCTIFRAKQKQGSEERKYKRQRLESVISEAWKTGL